MREPMTTAHLEAISFPEGLASTPALYGLIEQAIKRYTKDWRLFPTPVGLKFPEELEAVYEVETRMGRIRELRFTLTAAAVFQILTAVSDPLFIPDLHLQGLWLRLLVAVIMLTAVFSLHMLSTFERELVVSGAVFTFMVVVIGLPFYSTSPLAPWELFSCILGIIYANTTAPLRFRFAWPFTLLCLAVSAASLFFNPRVGVPLAGAIMLQMAVGASFSLIANYRMERSARLGYLLASKEALRLFALNRDRDRLATRSSTDALTGIANRGHFDRRLTELFGGTFEDGTRVGLILLDVDHFKRYNDHYGHPAGDECLKAIAAVLTRVMRGQKDFGFRYGGEEFGALLLGVSKGTAESIAERIRSAVEREGIEHQNREDGLSIVTVSVGVSCAAVGHGITPEELIAQADASLYAAKKAGRNIAVSLPR